MGNSAWHVKGKNPYDSLQSTDLVAASTGIDVANAPVYYSRLILAYMAMDRAGTIGTAGSKGVNLLNLLLTYQNTAPGQPRRALRPVPALDRRRGAHHLLGHPRDAQRRRQPQRRALRVAVAWLADQQNADGAVLPQHELGARSDALDTALAIRRCVPTRSGTSWHALCGAGLPTASSRSDGGFPTTPAAAPDAEATSAAIQTIVASGGNPDGAAGGWVRDAAHGAASACSSPTARTSRRRTRTCGRSP